MEIKPQWNNVVKRMQSAARQHDGTVIMQLMVIVNSDGVPVHWVLPKIVPIEPKMNSSIESLKKHYGEDDLKNILNFIMYNV